MHHLHVEHDPKLWIALLGGNDLYAAAVDAAFARVRGLGERRQTRTARGRAAL
jgi:hypothetical protein